VAWLGNAIAATFSLMTLDFDGFLSRSRASLEGLKWMFQGAWDSILSGFRLAMKVITGIWDKVAGSIGAGIDKISGAISWLGDKLGITVDAASGAAQQVNAASGTVASAQAGANPVNSQNTVNNSQSTAVSAPVSVTQHISTSDPKAAGEYAAAAVKREQRRAANNAQGAWNY
jgi:hypothetical protein